MRRELISRFICSMESNVRKHLPGLFLLTVLLSGSVAAQTSVSRAWVADNRNGTYLNPILHADYSDPDWFRVERSFRVFQVRLGVNLIWVRNFTQRRKVSTRSQL